MATIDFLLQGLSSENDHLQHIGTLLSMDSIDKCLISVAFMNLSGAEVLLDKVAAIKSKVNLYVGIRNGITSLQAIKKLLDAGIYPLCVDTATPNFIFHPKVYLAASSEYGQLIVGSANFTPGGLFKNIEASLVTHLDLSIKSDKDLIDNIFASFEEMRNQSPENVIELTSAHDLLELVAQGVLIDETNPPPRLVTKASSSSSRSVHRPRMKVSTRSISITSRSRHSEPLLPGAVVAGVINNNLLWKSEPLSRRDLNIPTGSNTNRTGSMLLKLGDRSQKIDFQHYFRDEAFATANWVKDPPTSRTPHHERAVIKSRIVIKGIDYGIFNLALSHNTDTTSKSYLQRNGTTGLRWRDAKPLIADEDLLGDIMCIYAPDAGSDVYTITIDDD